MVMKLVPGKALGPFHIGMVLSQAIEELQSNYSAYNVNFHYDDTEPLESDVFLDIPDMGFRLRFEPIAQRLRLIDVYDCKRLVMSYHGASWSGPGAEATFIRVYDLFGPTFPGKLEPARGDYFLHYRGLSFTFSIPREFHPLYQSSNDMPLELPNRTTPIVSRVFVYCGSDLLRPEMPPAAGHYCERVEVAPDGDCGLRVKFTGRDSAIGLCSTLQDVLSELGPPSRVFNKPRPKMSIHSIQGAGLVSPVPRASTSHRNSGHRGGDDAGGSADGSGAAGLQRTPRHDYFLNYFSLGVDVLMDGTTHTVSKIVLHSNFPGHPEFNQYAKCNFAITWPKQAGGGVDEATHGSGAGAGAGAGGGTARTQALASFDVNMKWAEIEERMGGCGGRPMVHGSLANPFGSTYLYAYSGMVVEVMKSSGHVATVTLFDNGARCRSSEVDAADGAAGASAERHRTAASPASR